MKRTNANNFEGQFGLGSLVFSSYSKSLEQRLTEVSKEVLFMSDNDIKCVSTGDKIHIYAYYPKINEPKPKKKKKNMPKRV